MWKWLFFSSLTIGCGGSEEVDPPDASLCDRTAGVVTVRTRPELSVIAHDRTGAIAGQTSSGSTGEVQIDVPACGMVTVARVPGELFGGSVLTWTDVRGGDVLAFGAPPTAMSSSEGTVVTFAPMTGAGAYSIGGGCVVGAGGRPGYDIDCQGTSVSESPASFYLHGIGTPPIGTVFAMARDQQVPVSYAFATGVTPGDMVVLPTWRTDYDDVTVTATNVPVATVPSLGVGLGFGPAMGYWPSPELVDRGGGNWSSTVQVPIGPTARIARIAMTPGTSIDALGLIAHPLATPAVTIDVGATMLPYIDAMAIDMQEPPILNWTVATGADAADAVVLEVGGGARWWLIAPPEVRSVQLPQLPAELLVTTERSLSALTIIDVDGINGYREAIGRADELGSALFRPAPFRISSAGDSGPLLFEFR